MNMADVNVNASNVVQMPYMGNLNSADRNAALKLIAQSVGIELVATRVPEGESFIASGEAAMRKLKGEVNALPDLAPGMDNLRAAILTTVPRDIVVPIQRVRMENTKGGLFGQGSDSSKALGYSNTGLNHVVSFIKPSEVRQGAVSVLKSVPPGIRAQVFNHWAENARTDEDKVVLRTALAGERRIVRAVASQRHSLEHGDDVALSHLVQSSLPKGGKLRVIRDQDRTDFEILFPMMSREVKVGDAVMAKVHVTNSETKQGSWTVYGGILRALCFNFTTAWCGKNTEVSGRHIGDDVGRNIAKAVRQALLNVEPFIQAFGDAYSNALPEQFPTRGEVLGRVGKALELPESTLDLASKLWDADGSMSAGSTLGGLVNALTRASQELEMEKAQVVEHAAGRLTFEGWSAIA